MVVLYSLVLYEMRGLRKSAFETLMSEPLGGRRSSLTVLRSTNSTVQPGYKLFCYFGHYGDVLYRNEAMPRHYCTIR